MAKANDGNGTRLSVEQKTSMRKMIAHYWENSSIFGLDLVGVVMRHCTFIQKMNDIVWINSPKISATVAKLIRKYSVFFDVMVKYKKQQYLHLMLILPGIRIKNRHGDMSSVQGHNL
jgi:hypothetical protein